MAINGVTYGTSSVLNQSVLNLKTQMATLQSQLTTGTKSTSDAGMGTNEGFAIAARSQMADISAFTDTQSNINTDIGIANTQLQAMVDIGTTVLNGANSTNLTLNSAGQTIAQQTAASQFSSMVGVLNVQAGDRYLVSGPALSTHPTPPADATLYGPTHPARVQHMVSQRRPAQLRSSRPARVLLT